jgi:hypothetical protein
MKVPRYWHRDWVRVPSKYEEGKLWSIPRWGWSESSLEEAEKMAAQRCWQTKQNWMEKATDSHTLWYKGLEYFAQPPREEIIQEIGNEEQGIDGWVSRNRYGVLVLNTDVMLIIDIDRQETPLRKVATTLWSNWFRQRVPSEEEKLIELCKAQTEDAFRLYRTYAGWRAILLNRAVGGVDNDSLAIMKKFPVDPFYLKLCIKQKCFRARLTAKPWRIGLERCPISYPHHPNLENHYLRWEQQYNAEATKYRVCEKIYDNGFPCERLKTLLEIHDAVAQVNSDLPIA